MEERNGGAPKISVIIPLYNKAPSIKRALDSVLRQTIQDFEIVVVNDGSTDNGEKIVEKTNDSRIRLINQNNQGVSAARNNGVAIAKSDLVAFLDADDEWTPIFLETILRLRDAYPDAGLYGTGYKRITPKREIDWVVKSGELIIQDWFYTKNTHKYMIICTSGMAIPKKTFLEVGGFPLAIAQGEDRYIRARIALAYPIAYSSSIGAIYHVDKSTTAARYSIYQNDSFSAYVSTNISKLSHRADFNDILEFCDYAISDMCACNLKNRTNPTLVRKDIRKIKSKIYLIDKYLLLLTSYVPKKFLPICVNGYYAVHHLLSFTKK